MAQSGNTLLLFLAHHASTRTRPRVDRVRTAPSRTRMRSAIAIGRSVNRLNERRDQKCGTCGSAASCCRASARRRSASGVWVWRRCARRRSWSILTDGAVNVPSGAVAIYTSSLEMRSRPSSKRCRRRGPMSLPGTPRPSAPARRRRTARASGALARTVSITLAIRADSRPHAAAARRVVDEEIATRAAAIPPARAD